MLLFIGNSLRTASASALRTVPLDWQAPVSSYSRDLAGARAVVRQPGIAEAAPTATAPFASASHSGRAGHINTGSGSILAVPPRYLSHLKTFRYLQGRLRPGSIVLDQQLAATLQARIGDTVRLTPRPGAPPRAYRVSGIALITAPDQVFQPLNPALGPAPAQPPSNAAILPLGTFSRTFAPKLPAIAAPGIGANAQPGAQKGVQWQVQAQLHSAPLASGSPSAALKLADQTRLRVERSVPGNLQFVDNLSDSLNTAAGDALYAETLYILLAAPGALIALGVAYLAALGTSERDRRDLALLRARGAAASVLRREIAHGRRSAVRDRPPFWQRYWLDVAALALSGLIYWLTIRTGFAAVISPDANPTLSLSIYMFFGPALLWVGATLLLVRLRGRGLAWLAGRAASRRPGSLGSLVLASAGRRGSAIHRGLAVVGLLLAFGVSLAIFSATYDQQARVDAQLTLGADVTVDVPPSSHGQPNLAARVARAPGVAATTRVEHSYAYVGPDLQDTFGVDPASLTRA